MDAKDAVSPISPETVNCREIGVVSNETKKAVVDAVTEVFKKMDFAGQPPEIISISQGAVVLPDGEEIESCYNFDPEKKGKPGKILVSAEKSKDAFKGSDIPIEVATAAFAAHEAVEHVNHMKGKELLIGSSIIPSQIHAKSPTENEANLIAREVIKNLFGWTVYFGDETPPDN
mgnify:FL=1